MPVEIIDLLSSPDTVVPSRPRPPAAAINSRPPISDAAEAVQQAWSFPRPGPTPRPVAENELSDDGFLDLTDPTVLSSFQTPLSKPSTTSRVAALAPSAYQPKSPKRTSRADDLTFWSDDYDITVDLSEAISDPRPAKKSRIELSGTRNSIVSGPSYRTIQRSTSGPVDGPAIVRKPLGPIKGNSKLDPIQTSSDPFASSPHEAPPPRASIAIEPATRALTAGDIIDLCKDSDDNPFASSPDTNKEKGREARLAQPGVAQLLSSPLLLSSPVSNHGGSTLPNAKSKGKGKQLPAWDHISSSAPETNNHDDDWLHDEQPRTSRGSLKRCHSDMHDFKLHGSTGMSESSEDGSLPDVVDLPPLRGTVDRGKSTGAVKNTAMLKKSAAEKAIRNLDKAAAREAEKRRKQKEKEKAREVKKEDKERAAALAEVNKVRTDKKVSTPEMIVDLPLSLNPSVKLQIETLLGDLNVKCHSYSSPVKNVVNWRRKVKARFNEDEGHWEPIPERIEPEKHTMVIMPAAEFVELALGPRGSDLEAHILRLQRTYENHTLVYLIEGLVLWMRRNKAVRDRQFKSAVRNAGAEVDVTGANDAAPPPSTQRGKKKDPKPSPVYIDEDSVEDALLQLQVLHGALVHHTTSAIETAQWVSVFTQHISTIPYRKQKDAVNASAAFCMDSGQVRTGEGAQDTYVRMLQEIVRVTPAIAYGIASKFPTAKELVNGFIQQGPLALEGIKKSANKDGAFTDRTVGQAISKRLHKVFTGRDEASTDI